MFGEFAREQRAQHVGDGQSALKGGDLDAAALSGSDVDREPRGVETWLRISRRRGLRRCAPRLRRRSGGRRRRAWDRARSSRDPLDLGGERGDLARGGTVRQSTSPTSRPLRAASAKPTRWPIRRGEHRRIVVGKRLGGARAMSVRAAQRLSTKRATSCGAEDARLGDELQHLAGGPAVERRGLRRDQDEIGREQGRAHQAGNARRPVDDDVAGVSRELGRLAMEGVARKADDAEEPRQAFLGALLGPVERRALRVGVDQGDALALAGPLPGEMQGERGLADAALLIEERDDHRAPAGIESRMAQAEGR